MSAAQYYSGQPPQGHPQYQGQQQPQYEGQQQPQWPQNPFSDQPHTNNNFYNQNKQQQQYQPPPPPNNGPYMAPSQPYVEPNNSDSQPLYASSANPQHPVQNENNGQRFKVKKRINDPFFLIFFLATFAGFVVLSALAIRQFVKYSGGNGGFGGDGQGGTGITTSLNYHTVYLLLIASALGLFLTALYLMMVRTFTKVIMEITLALSVLLNIGVCVYYFVMKYWSGAVIFLVIAIISILSYWFMRKRIPFARILLQTVMDISNAHKGVYVVVVIALIVQTAMNIWYTFTIVSIYVTWTPGNPACATNSCSGNKVAGLIAFATFAFLWISQVIANVTLATLAGGTYGNWYYQGPGNHLKGANKKAFVRATTTSLGSIAFGSLIVTILELLRNLLNAVANQQASEGDAISAILACCAACCVSCIASLVAWFNRYAYIEIALYGKAYIPAAKDAWNLLKHRGIDALVNDSLVNITLTTGAYIVGLLTALFAYLYLRYTNPDYNRDGNYTAPVILFGALIGINTGLALANALEAGVSTIFVGLGEDPYVLQERSPGLFEEIKRTYPQVLNPI